MQHESDSDEHHMAVLESQNSELIGKLGYRTEQLNELLDLVRPQLHHMPLRMRDPIKTWLERHGFEDGDTGTLDQRLRRAAADVHAQLGQRDDVTAVGIGVDEVIVYAAPGSDLAKHAKLDPQDGWPVSIKPMGPVRPAA